MCQLEQTAVLGQDLFAAPTGVLGFHPEMQRCVLVFPSRDDGLGPVSVCVISWPALELAGNVFVCLLSVGCSWRWREGPKDAPECSMGLTVFAGGFYSDTTCASAE